MREIKSRVWDKNSEQMINEGGFITMHGNGSFQVFIESSGEWEENGDKKGSDLIIMYYAGGEDKNGKEVYGGDVFKWRLGHIESIQWDEELNGWNIDKSGLSTGEVIGNTFENPELLKGG